jgi:excisionase family DNA binding protein
MEPLVVSVKEAGRLLNFSPAKMFKLLRDGTLESTKIGSSRRIYVASIKSLLEAGKPPRKEGEAA